MSIVIGQIKSTIELRGGAQFQSNSAQMHLFKACFPAIFWKKFCFLDSPVIFKAYFSAFMLSFWQDSMIQIGNMEQDHKRTLSQDSNSGCLRHTTCQSTAHKALKVYHYFYQGNFDKNKQNPLILYVRTGSSIHNT